MLQRAPIPGRGLPSAVAAVPASVPAACARRGMLGQAGLGAATCLEELSEERHPPGAPAGRVARGPLPAAGCPLRALPAPGRWSCASGRAGGQGSRHPSPRWHCWKGSGVPSSYQCQWESGAGWACGGAAHGAGVQEPLFPQPPEVRVPETEGWGTPQNTPSPPSPCPRHLLCVTTLGQPCPGIQVGRGSPGMGRGERGSPPSRAPRPRCQNPPLAAAASGRSRQGKDAWNSCPGAERDRSKY